MNIKRNRKIALLIIAVYCVAPVAFAGLFGFRIKFIFTPFPFCPVIPVTLPE